MTKKLEFAVENVEFLEEENDSQFATAEIEAFSSGYNLHDLTCTVDTLEKTAHTIYEKPVIFELDPSFYDFGSHNEDITVPAGFVVPNTAEYVKRDDGRISLKVRAKIWKRYAKDFIKIFKMSDQSNKKVSVEMEVYKYGEPDKNGISELLEFAYTAIAVLGDFVTPASEGANMQMVSFAKDRNDYEIAYRSEFAKYSELNFSIPKGIKKNSQNGLTLYERDGGAGMTGAAALAKHIVRSEALIPERVRQIAKYFARTDVNRPSDKSGSEWVKWQLYGGNISKRWATTLMDEMDIMDDELLSYFDTNQSCEDGEGIKETQDMNKKDKELLEAEVEESTEDVEFEAKVEDENVTMEEEAKKPEKEEEMAEEEDEEEAEEEMGYKEDEMAENKEGEEEKEEEMSNFVENLMGLFEVSDSDEKLLFATISDRIAELESENTKLKEFKAEVETERFEYEVNVVLNEVKDVLGEDAIEKAREDSKEFSLESIDGWKNAVRAQAFAVSKDIVEEEVPGEDFTRVETVFAKKEDSNSVWN